jgi:hypothetical protein
MHNKKVKFQTLVRLSELLMTFNPVPSGAAVTSDLYVTAAKNLHQGMKE